MMDTSDSRLVQGPFERLSAPLQTYVRNWWAVMLRGLAAVMFGILALAAPAIGLGALVVIFALYAAASGILSFLGAIRAHEQGRSWGVMVVEGVLSLAAGVVAVVWPGLTVVTLLWVVAFWAIITGVMQVVAAIRLRREIKGEWLLALGGVLSVAFGVLALLRPILGALTIVWLLGIYSLLFGFALIGLGFRLGRLKSLLPPPRPTVPA
jgi:uncharacterized membrane protein HdeD (DUF308 family)